MEKENTWLVLAHLFNMDGNAASLTITDRLPFMLKAGIRPVIISSPTGFLDKNFEHYQVFSMAPSGIRWEMRYVINKKIKSQFLRTISKALRTILCLPFYLVEKILIHLDCHWSWFISAFIKAFKVIKKSRPRVIYSTAGPSSTHLAGYLISKWHNIPWVAELHDPLVMEDEKRNIQKYYFNKWLEKIIFNHASIVIYFTENALNNAAKRNFHRKNTYVIRPGTNPPEFPNIAYKKRDIIHFSHFGVLAKGRNLTCVMKAVFKLVQRRPDLKEVISLDLFGDDLDSVSINALSSYPISDMIHYHGRLTRRNAIANMKKSDVLLLLHGEGESCKEYIPSKVYEYMLTQRPILACTCAEYELGQFLLKSGYPVAGKDSDSIQEGILNYIDQWQAHGLPDVKAPVKYTVAKAVDLLIKAVDSL